jgi:hypothetical protein
MSAATTAMKEKKRSLVLDRSIGCTPLSLWGRIFILNFA